MEHNDPLEIFSGLVPFTRVALVVVAVYATAYHARPHPLLAACCGAVALGVLAFQVLDLYGIYRPVFTFLWTVGAVGALYIPTRLLGHWREHARRDHGR